MVYDMRPLNCDDCGYDRTVNGKLESDLVIDLAEGLTEMAKDFYAGRCTDAVLYDYDYGIAFCMVEQTIEDKDFEMMVVDTTVTVKEYLQELEAKIADGYFDV